MPILFQKTAFLWNLRRSKVWSLMEAKNIYLLITILIYNFAPLC